MIVAPKGLTVEAIYHGAQTKKSLHQVQRSFATLAPLSKAVS